MHWNFRRNVSILVFLEPPLIPAGFYHVSYFLITVSILVFLEPPLIPLGIHDTPTFDDVFQSLFFWNHHLYPDNGILSL